MHARALGLFVPILLACHAPGSDASAVASGRNWRVAIESIDCEAAASRVTIAARIRYLGPKGLAEAPVARLVDGERREYLPRSLVWKGGGKELAAWLAAGGMRNVQSEYASDLQLRFEVRGASGDLRLELGDLEAIVLTRKGTSAAAGVCGTLLKLDQLKLARRPAPARADGPAARIRIYRSAYPCMLPPGALRTIEADHPPYLPEQLLVFGRGYLPAARHVELPMGPAAAQAYAYSGPDTLDATEDAARRALAADFPRYRSQKYFTFNWGVQRAPTGNELYAIGIYALRACPGAEKKKGA